MPMRAVPLCCCPCSCCSAACCLPALPCCCCCLPLPASACYMPLLSAAAYLPAAVLLCALLLLPAALPPLLLLLPACLPLSCARLPATTSLRWRPRTQQPASQAGKRDRKERRAAFLCPKQFLFFSKMLPRTMRLNEANLLYQTCHQISLPCRRYFTASWHCPQRTAINLRVPRVFTASQCCLKSGAFPCRATE